ncbi:MAG: type I restriction-modification system subunit M N-terminal domain-containing protein [Cyanobium sp.]
MTDSATFTSSDTHEGDLGDLLLEVLPPDGSTMGNLSAREALSLAAERPVGEEEYETVRNKALSLGLVIKGRGRGGSIALAEGIEGGSRYLAPAVPSTGNGRGRAKKEAAIKDFKAVLWASADKLRAQMDAAEYKHLVLGLIFLKFISDTFTDHQARVLQMVSDPSSDWYVGEDPADQQAALADRDYYQQDNVFWVPEQARWEVLRAQAKQPASAPASMQPWWRSRMKTRSCAASSTVASAGRSWSQAGWVSWWI